MNRTSVFATAAFVIGVSAQASEVTYPHTFQSGQPAVAAEVNANFDAVKDAVDDNDANVDAVASTVEANSGRIAALEQSPPFKTGHISISPADLDLRSGEQPGTWYKTGAELFASETSTFITGVRLPHGARITSVTGSFEENDGDYNTIQVSMGLVQHELALTLNSTTIASLPNVSDNGIRLIQSVETDAIVDNQNYSYVFIVSFSSGATTTTHGFYGASIEYEYQP